MKFVRINKDLYIKEEAIISVERRDGKCFINCVDNQSYEIKEDTFYNLTCQK